MDINSIQNGSTDFSIADFDLQNFKAGLNYTAASDLPETIQTILHEELFPALQDTVINYQFRVIPIEKLDGKRHIIALGGTQALSGSIIYRLLKNCSHVVGLLVSISGEKMAEGWHAFLAYSFYNTLIQMTLDRVRFDVLASLAISEPELTQRYAPGYCGWPVHDQASILAMLQPEKIGVEMDRSFILQPMHSVTGVYGIRKNAGVHEKMPCYDCTSISCRVHNDFHRELNQIQAF